MNNQFMETEWVRVTTCTGRTAVITKDSLREMIKAYELAIEATMNDPFLPEDERQRRIDLWTFKTIEEVETPEWYKKKMEQEALTRMNRLEELKMNCKMEENSRLYDVLSVLEDGYTTGNFEGLFPFLAQDCVMESQWVLTPNTGYEAVTAYFTGKGNTLAKSGNFPSCSIVELLGNCNPVKNASVSLDDGKPEATSLGLMYTPGKLCLEMRQTIDDKENAVIVDVTLNESGLVKRIDLCMPELFNYRGFYTFVEFYPVTDDCNEENGDYDNREHLIRVSAPYYRFLYLFMDCAGKAFDEYGDLHIPMKTWLDTLDYWKSFATADNFDEAFEKIAGVDYDSNTIQNQGAAKYLGESGTRMWEDRENSRNLLEGLIEWTELYKDKYSYINTCGW